MSSAKKYTFILVICAFLVSCGNQEMESVDFSLSGNVEEILESYYQTKRGLHSLDKSYPAITSFEFCEGIKARIYFKKSKIDRIDCYGAYGDDKDQLAQSAVFERTNGVLVNVSIYNPIGDLNVNIGVLKRDNQIVHTRNNEDIQTITFEDGRKSSLETGTQKLTYQYDDAGRLLKVKHVNKNKLKTESSFDYIEFDSQGNWVKRIENVTSYYADGGQNLTSFVRDREITYSSENMD